MKMRIIYFTLLIGSLIACKPQNVAQTVSVSETDQMQSTTIQVSEVMNDDEEAQLNTPTPGDVIYAKKKKKGDGSDAYEVSNGSWAHFWYGQTYKIDGVFYYTAFIYQTPDFNGKPEERGEPAPATQASIAQATFKKSDSNAEKPWDFVGSEPDIGTFGSYEKGDDVDESRQVITFQTGSERYFWAIPTQSLAGGGVAISSYEIFWRNKEGRWKHAGYIVSGEDNSAGCAESKNSGLPPCFINTGELVFSAKSEMPDIQVKMLKTTTDSLGEAEKSEKQDISIYSYDPKSGHYQLVKK